MLSFLHIENIAVIKKLDIDFASGFTALTGETGAGKSIIIDGIGLLMGERGSRELIRSGEESATVNAIFENIGEEARGGEGACTCRSEGGSITQTMEYGWRFH